MAYPMMRLSWFGCEANDDGSRNFLGGPIHPGKFLGRVRVENLASLDQSSFFPR